MDDWQLLQDFCGERSERAFTALVSRYVNLVYTSALRQVGQPHLAEEVSQSVFLLLARKAPLLRHDIVLAGWLFRATRFLAARALRSEIRRKLYEQEAFEMQELSSPDDSWHAVAPIIDDALDHLSKAERNAVLVRFMDHNSLRDTGAALGITEDAAKKRVARGLEKLREFFKRRGFAIPTVIVGGALSENLTSAAPSGLAAQIASAAVNLPVAQSVFRWTSLKMAAGVVGLGILLTMVIVTSRRNAHPPSKIVSTALSAPVALATTGAAAAERAIQGLNLRVIDAETGQGIPAVRTLILYWQNLAVEPGPALTTDADGLCRVSLPPNLVRLDLGVLVDWYVYKCVMFYERTVWPIPTEFTLKLERAVSIGGWVRDPSGAPLKNADIFLNLDNLGGHSEREPRFEGLGFVENISAARTDTDGRWACAVLPRNYKQFTIRVSHSDYLPEVFSTDAQSESGVPMSELWAGQAVITLKGRKSLSLVGWVIDQKGSPISGAMVEGGHWSDKPDAITDANGSFKLTGLNPGTNGMTIAARGFAPERVTVDLTSNTPPLDVQLKPGNLLRVRVLDEAKLPVAGAFVALSRWKERGAYNWRANTDADGFLQWADAPADALTLDVLKSGYFESRDNPAQADGDDRTILLRKSMVVSGTVVDQETGQRIPRFKIIPGYQHPDSWQWFRSDRKIFEHGYYEYAFETWRPPFTVRIEADGYEVATSKALLPEPREQTWDFALKRIDPTGVVHGAVLLPDGRPARNAEVSLGTFDFDIRLGDKRLLRQQNTFVTNVNERGEFEFPPDPNAHTVVALSPEGFAQGHVRPGKPVRMQLQPWGRIEGIVRVPNPAQHPRSVHLNHAGAGNYRGCIWLMDHRTDVDEDGRFILEAVPPGDLICILYDAKGIPGHKVPVTVLSGKTTQVQIGGGGSVVTGRLTTTKAVNWAAPNIARLEASLEPTPRFGAPDDPATHRRKADFWLSGEGVSRSRASQMYPLEVSSTGAFHVHDVPAGNYRLVATFSNAWLTTNVIVVNEPTDLGELVVY